MLRGGGPELQATTHVAVEKLEEAEAATRAIETALIFSDIDLVNSWDSKSQCNSSRFIFGLGRRPVYP